MDEKNFVLSYYKNADANIHVQRIENSAEAQKPHTHDYFQIYYISKGTLSHVTQSGSSRLARGDMFIIPPGRVHYIKDVEGTLFYTFSFTRESLGTLGDEGPLSLRFLKKLEKEENVRAKISVRDDELLVVEGIMERMYAEFEEKHLGYADVVRAYAVILLTVFARNYYLSTETALGASDNRSLVLYSIEYINENFSKDISLSTMCKWCAMSKSSFCKLFASLTGKTFHRYLNLCRIRGAVKYIEEGYKITAIYGLVGYNDFATFYRNFKRIMGCSPMTYKNSAKKNE